jgi:translocation and assembly module TamB
LSKRINLLFTLKKAFRILKILCLYLALIFFLLVGAVNLPFVQRIITRKANNIFHEKGLPLHVGKVTFLISGKVEIEKTEFIGAGNDTVVYAGKIKIAIHPFPLLLKRVDIKDLALNDVVVNLTADSISGKLKLLSYLKPGGKSNTVKKERKAWDIEADAVHLKNIRFMYDSPKNGILIKQNLYKADVLFNKFSILQKLISVNYIRLEKADGKLDLNKTELIEKEGKKASGTFAWKISLNNLRIDETFFSLNQRSGLRNTEIVSKLARFDGSNIELQSNKLNISKLKVEKPDIVYNISGKNPQGVKSSKSGDPFSSKKAFSVECSALNIKNGSFFMKNEPADSIGIMSKLLPVKDFNTVIRDFRFSNETKGCDINTISFASGDQNILQSGRIIFNTDSAKSVNLSIDLAATLNKKYLPDNSRNDTILLSATLSGSMENLEVEKIKVHAPSGIDLFLSGSIKDPLKIPASVCKVNLLTGTITQKEAVELLGLFGTAPSLPLFKPFILSGSIDSSFLTPRFNLELQSKSGNIKAEGNIDLKNKLVNLTAFLNHLRLGELFGMTGIDYLNGSVILKTGWKNQSELSGEGSIQVDSILYKDVVTGNISVGFSVNQNQGKFNIVASDKFLNCGLNGLFSWGKNEFQAKLSGNFNIDEGGLHLIKFPLKTKSEISASLSKKSGNLESSLDLNNFYLTKGTETSCIKNTSLVFTSADSLVKALIKTDFITADFQTRASLTDLVKTLKNSLATPLLSKDSTGFLNLEAISMVPEMKMDMTVQYDSIFGLFVPDTVLNFSSFRIVADKKRNNSLVQAEISAKRLKFKSFEGYGALIDIRGEPGKLFCSMGMDSIRTGGVLLGSSKIGLDILQKNVIGRILINNPKGLPFYQLNAEVVKRNNRIIFATTDPEWILNSNTWTISAGDILTIDKSGGDITASIHLQHNDMKIDLYGRRSENLKIDIQNVLISMFIPPAIILKKPDGILSANVTYRENDKKTLDFNINLDQIKWYDVELRQLVVTGNLIADSSGIMESNIIARINDTSTVTLDFGNKGTGSLPGQMLHSTFNDIPLQIAEPFIRNYANQIQGNTSGDITLTKKENNFIIDGEIGINNAALRVIPLNTRFSFPEEKILIKQNMVNFNQFIIKDSLQKQLIVNGTINMNDQKNITTDINITSDKLQVMNTSDKDNPAFFGSIFLRSGIDITGPLSNPSIKGTLALESGTDVTYRYKGDETVSETQKIITFAKLNGNQLEINNISSQKKELSKMPSIQTSIEITPKSVFNFEISSSFDVGVKISGSGFLNYEMLPNNTMSLAGSYEIQQGTTELKMVGWPRKYFTIVAGSSIRWNGKIDDPEINLEATSRVRSSYENPIDNKNRDVDFFVSMKISNQLSQVNIVFDVKCPDQYITSVLATLSPEERMMQAVNLLLFEGINLPEIKSTNNYLTSQINGFWENQLNSMTKSNVKKVNLSFGIDSYTETSSAGEQDYSSLTYEVEKKMFRNRGSVKVSGRVTDVKQPGQTSNNMIENFSFEYALDSLESKYLKLYRKQDYEDILEGQVIKSGVGFVYRKTYDGVKEIWQRKEKKKSIQKQEPSGKQ